MRQKLKNIVKILTILILICTIFFSISTISIASDTETATEESNGWNVLDAVGGVIDGLLNILLYFIKLIPLAIGGAIQGIITGIATIGGAKFESGFYVSMEDIIFTTSNSISGFSGSGVGIVLINFFTPKGNTVLSTMQTSIATWYYALRNLAIIISLAVLIYVGIRMAISTMAEDKAKYKKMLMDWIVGFILIFLLHYIIIITISATELLVDAMNPNNLGVNLGHQTSDYAGELVVTALSDLSFVKGLAASIIYVCLMVLTGMFLISYIKRMLTIAFLIIIAPIITVTYSIDKMGDGKSQALNTWLKEFVYNVLIQPFHCVTYLVFMGTIMSLLKVTGLVNLGAGVLAIIIMFFIKKVEPIIRKIFGFENAGSLGSAITSGALLMGSMKIASNALEKSKKSKSASGSSSSSSSSSKPTASSNANRNTNNINNQNKKTKTNQSNSKGSNSTGTSQKKKKSTNAGSNSTGSQAKNNQAQDKELNTSPLKTNGAKVADAVKKLATTTAKIGMGIGAGAIGAFASNDPISGAITGVNFGRAGIAGVSTLANSAKYKGMKLVNSVKSRSRMAQKRDDLIDAYNGLKKSTGWGTNRMYHETEKILEIEDLDKISNPRLRDYAQKAHSYRDEFEGKYQSPTDMVLDTIDKVQRGEIKKGSSQKYTRKKRK